jgi:hypothetical protein
MTSFWGNIVKDFKRLRCLVCVTRERRNRRMKRVDKEYKTTSLKFEFVSHSAIGQNWKQILRFIKFQFIIPVRECACEMRWTLMMWKERRKDIHMKILHINSWELDTLASYSTCISKNFFWCDILRINHSPFQFNVKSLSILSYLFSILQFRVVPFKS